MTFITCDDADMTSNISAAHPHNVRAMRPALWPVPLATGILQVPLVRWEPPVHHFSLGDGFAWEAAQVDAVNAVSGGDVRNDTSEAKVEANIEANAASRLWTQWMVSSPHGLPQPEEVALWDYKDILYTTELKVGPAGNPLRVMVDTGSSNLWLKQSMVKTAEVTDYEAHVTYGLGDVFGKAATDRMCLAALCVWKQTFLLAFEIKGMGRNSDLFDGILGMAFPRMLDIGSRTFFQDLGVAGGFSNPGFGLVLRDSHHHSFLTMGEVPDLIQDAQEKASTKGVTLDVHGFETLAQQEQGQQGQLLFWLVAMDLRVHMVTSTGLLLELTGYGIVDSGTSLLLLPMPAYNQALWALTFGLPKIHFHHGLVPCDGTRLNQLVFHFPGRDGELLLSLSTEDILLPAGKSPNGHELCKIGISPLQDDGKTLPHMILGDVFLRKVSSIFDLQGATVTFVPEGSPEVKGKGLDRLNADPPLAEPDALVMTMLVVFVSVAVVTFVAVLLVRRAQDHIYHVRLPN